MIYTYKCNCKTKGAVFIGLEDEEYPLDYIHCNACGVELTPTEFECDQYLDKDSEDLLKSSLNDFEAIR